jgi:membrane associated rhomboid family serine protease
MSAPDLDPAETQSEGRLARMPRVVVLLVLAIVAAHAATYLLDSRAYAALIDTFGVVPARFSDGDAGLVAAIAALTGNVFLHAGLMHLFFNVVLILQTGELVAERFGRDFNGAWRFLVLFFASAAAGAAAYIAINWGSNVPAIGASGAACGLFAAFLLARQSDWRVALRSPAVL